jgi:hypothetical protein
MKHLLHFQLACCLIFLASGIAVLAYYKTQVPKPPLLQDNPQFVSDIKSMSNIEGLRAVLQTVVLGNDRAAVADRAALDAAVEFLVSVLFLSAAAFAFCFVSTHRVLRRTRSNDESAL